MNRIARLLVVVLASGWFVPVSCSTAGIEPVSTRHGPVSRGVMMGALFYGFILAFVIYLVAEILKFVLRGRVAPPASPQ